jgi:hypothetical protein
MGAEITGWGSANRVGSCWSAPNVSNVSGAGPNNAKHRVIVKKKKAKHRARRRLSSGPSDKDARIDEERSKPGNLQLFRD